MLGFRHAGATHSLVRLNTRSQVRVSIDLASHTYSVAVNGTPIQTQIPFANNVALDTVRFFTDALNDVNFAGRTFDNLSIRTTSIPLAASTGEANGNLSEASVPGQTSYIFLPLVNR
jgi:hypothetical protein